MSKTSKNLFGKKAYWTNSMPIPYTELSNTAVAIAAKEAPRAR